MAYLYTVSFVVRDDIDNLSYQNLIDRVVQNGLANHHLIDIVGSQICELDNNCGQCCKCGVWVSDFDKADHINGFSDGCLIDDSWWCDVCLPNDHPKYFG